MRLIWTGRETTAEVRLTLRGRGYDPSRLGLPEDAGGLIDRPFPVLVSQSGRFIEEAFSFLFDIAFLRGSTRSARTLTTYAESLHSWLSYAERRGLQWRKPITVMLAAFRDHLLGTDGVDRGPRPLSRRTVNLRLTVAIEFYKHLGWIPIQGSDRSPPHSLTGGRTARIESVRAEVRRHDFRRLRVRVYSLRPKALPLEHCRALCQALRPPYRLMWQWALCTGLRTCSLVRITLQGIEHLKRRTRWGQTIELVGKGGKVVGVHVPDELLAATLRYLEVDRLLVAGRPRRGGEVESLFLNAHGRAVTGKGFYRALKRAGARLKIAVRPHQARSTFATFVRDRLEARNEAGSNLDAVKVVQFLLAHADASTTEQYLESIDVPSLDVLQVLDELARTALPTQVMR
jgi:integrase